MAGTFLTITDSVRYFSDHDGGKEAIVFLNKHGRQSVLSRRFMFETAGRFAARLRRVGFQKGDIIANSITNSPERGITDLGIILAGCVGINCQVIEKDGADFWHLTNVTKCTGLVLATKENNPAYLLLSNLLSEVPRNSGSYDTSIEKAPSVNKLLVANRVDSSSNGNLHLTKRENATGAEPVSDFISDLMETEPEVYVADVDPSDLAYIFLTSGSTGFSKFVPRTHKDIMYFSNTYISDDFNRVIADRPFGWVGGFPYCYVGKGVTHYVQDKYDGQEATTPRELWSMYEREDFPGVSQSPGMIIDLIEEFRHDPPKYKLKALFASGQVLMKRLADSIGILTDCLVTLYGSTETIITTAMPILKKEDMEDYLSGKVLENAELRIVDDNLEEVPRGTKGQIVMKNDYTFSGYYKYNPNPSKPVFTSDGFFITGDTGMLDAEGRLFVYGREGDVVSKGTLLLYLSWSESLLMRCEGVQDAAVVPVYGKDGEEDKICACIVRKEDSDLDEEKLRDLYMDKFTHSYTSRDSYIPALDFVVFYDKFPETYTSKTNRLQLKREANNAFGSQ